MGRAGDQEKQEVLDGRLACAALPEALGGLLTNCASDDRVSHGGSSAQDGAAHAADHAGHRLHALGLLLGVERAGDGANHLPWAEEQLKGAAGVRERRRRELWRDERTLSVGQGDFGWLASGHLAAVAMLEYFHRSAAKSRFRT